MHLCSYLTHANDFDRPARTRTKFVGFEFIKMIVTQVIDAFTPPQKKKEMNMSQW
jgi:hypothetical protein